MFNKFYWLTDVWCGEDKYCFVCSWQFAAGNWQLAAGRFPPGENHIFILQPGIFMDLL
jgi:hypothetical protein